MTTPTPEAIESIVRQVETMHGILAYNGSQVVCACDRTWKPAEDYAAHITKAALSAAAPHIVSAKSADGVWTMTDAEFKRELNQAKAEAATPRAAILAEVSAERDRQDVKWGEQNHPNGTGDGVPLLHGVDLPKPHAHVGVTMGTLAYTARRVTDSYAATGQVTWADILLEEVGEAFAEHDATTLRAELIQVAAVAAQWVEAIDRSRATSIEGGN